MEIDHVLGPGAVVGCATTHSWGRPATGCARSDGRPHSCVVARPTTTPDAKSDQFLHLTLFSVFHYKAWTCWGKILCVVFEKYGCKAIRKSLPSNPTYSYVPEVDRYKTDVASTGAPWCAMMSWEMEPGGFHLPNPAWAICGLVTASHDTHKGMLCRSGYGCRSRDKRDFLGVTLNGRARDWVQCLVQEMAMWSLLSDALWNLRDQSID